jgi:hypothetical protein
MVRDFSMFLMVALYFSEFLGHMVILFGSIAQMYVDHVIKKYKDPVIVFDSYPELPSIKDVTHLRRTKGIVLPNLVNEIWVTNDKYPPQESLLFVECSIF